MCIRDSLHGLPTLIDKTLDLDGRICHIAEDFVSKHHALYLGRGSHYPIALEGALKLKEISYIHAEGYPSGELKHGPLALVDDDMPVVAVAPGDELIEKLKSNLEEVRARGAELLVFADEHSPIEEQPDVKVLRMPACPVSILPSFTASRYNCWLITLRYTKAQTSTSRETSLSR